jgi:predicted aspartyl protease
VRPWFLAIAVIGVSCQPIVRAAPRAEAVHLHITFVPEADSLGRATQVYDSLWASDGARITRALETAARLTFADIADTAVRAVVFEGVGSSGYREAPMHLRASYPVATKKATLMHELGHRLESDLFRASEDDHRSLFLWLYSAWVAAYGEGFAREQVAVEKRRGGLYPAAWDAALSLSPAERAARWDSVRASRVRVTQRPSWVAQLGYRPDEVFAVRRGYLGMPFLEVAIGDSTWSLLFDTGGMVGLTLATRLLDQLRLPVSGRWDRLDSDGRVIGSYRRVRAPVVRVLGRTLADEVISEFSDAALGGLVGPDALPGTRFTLDYRAGILASTSSPLQGVPPGFVVLPLTRSSRLPRLILATGRVNGRPVLIEFDTGASRTNIDPALVRELGLPTAGNGVRIDSLAIGPLVFSVPSARVNPKAGIDPTLSPPIQLAVGSDILGQLIFTVDYARGQLLFSDVRAP